MTTMRASWYERVGAARDVLTVGEVEIPEVTPGQVRVRVHASGINPSDVKQRSGWGGLTLRHDRVIPHNDGAGVIEAVGEGVAASRLGERVWLYEATIPGGRGTAAEYVVVPAEKAIALPDTTSFAAGACLGVPAMTAHRAVFQDGAVTGKTVLVTGGAGAVGFYAVQWAKWGGATVFATVSSAEKAAIAQTAGADVVLNYKTEDVVARVKELTNRTGVDRVVEVDFAANLATNMQVLKVDGMISTYASDSDVQPQVAVYPLIYKNLTVHYVLVYAMSAAAHQAAAADITTCLEAGVLTHQIAQRFTLDQVAIAHEQMENGGAIGKLIVEL